MSDDKSPPSIQGDRTTNSVTRALSVQSRLSNLLAIGLMSVLGLGSLTWYYAHTLSRQGRIEPRAVTRVPGDVSLPSLGRIDPPVPAPWFDPLPPSSDQPPARLLTEITPAPDLPSAGPSAPPRKTPSQLGTERELAGAVFSPNPAAPSRTATDRAPTAEAPGGAPNAAPGAATERREGDLAALLRPTVVTAVRAQVLPAQRLWLPKGAFIDCTLETAIDSTLPGMTTCVMATDAFGVDGDVVLLERGTKLVGETRGQLSQGAARVFVLWTEARTPAGVIVPLDSPGTDELGRSGLAGEINRHFWERFGAAMLVSVIDGAVQAAAASSRGGSGNIVVNPSASQDVVTEILKGTINIPPTVVKHNGDRIQVLVARDLDFRSVYELRSTHDR